MTVTIKDVARMAEVSISTVSRVINDSKPVSPEARRRVLKAIEELGYKPNEVARSLVTKKSNIIGIIVDDIGSSYVAQIIRGVEEVGRMYNYDLLLCSSYGDKESELRFAQLLMQKQVAGIIIVSEILNNDVLSFLDMSRIPFVYLNKYYNVLESPNVSINNREASDKVMRHLVEEGHKRIAYVTQEKDVELTIEKHKLEAYREWMGNIGGDPMVFEVDGHKIEDGYDIGNRIVERLLEEKITAVYCCEDEIAIGLINYLYDHNIKVPEDISVVGYGDITLASYFRPMLTTIKEPYYDIGAVSIRRILKVLQGEKVEEQTIVLPVQLIVRDSCASPSK
ncbi:LacI family DNA-binding transcriptional regulator [Gudongella oleilytica]|jgi:LacI family transcriptional regulator|uniref:LacI family DNA-binding transcriptional regulator n=1 Tax=Gudongella oleilytica TaxID=1582259 RepID=UPI000FF89905|nr:LacI family DNA-binding transcriptional regulator [Gudongella oleilytica]MDY0257705.1 LacI family DNA-binding transcriptional regulator [Gudongella oleilytica]HMM69685.1 LacI family DNA-binding transcriptional regulator [Gudongella oleilytica]